MGGGAGPSAAARAQEAENARLAAERESQEKSRRAALTNPEDIIRDNEKEESFRTRGRRGLKISLDSQTKSTGTGLAINKY